MFFYDRWLYFSIIINWNASEASHPETVFAFVTTVRQILRLVKAIFKWPGPGRIPCVNL